MDNKNDTPALLLSEVVNQFMLASFNDGRKYYPNYLVLAKWAWKQLLWNTIWQVKSKYIEVDKTTVPFSIPKPKDMVRFLNISDVDSCGNLQALPIDDYMNILAKPKQKRKCATHVDCGCEDSMCDAIGSLTVRVKDNIIDGEVFTEKIWNKKTDGGDFIEVREVPVKNYIDADNYTIVMDVQERLICSLDVNPCGCILPTEKNKKLIITHCGCFLSDCIIEECKTGIQKTKSDFGRIKLEGNTIFIDTKADYVILSYQTNGECNEEELLVPEIALDAVMFGIDYRAKSFRAGVPRYEKEQARMAYKGAKFDLEMYMNPIRIEEFLRIGNSLPKW